MMGQRRAGDAGLGLDLVDDETVGMRGEQQAHDAEPGLGAEGREHVGEGVTSASVRRMTTFLHL